MRPVALSERGNKCRLVTCSNPSHVSRAHGIRSRLFQGLFEIPEISRFLGKAPARIFVGHSGWLVSCDMSQATDTVKHSAAAWICSRLNIDPKLVFEGFLLETPEGVFRYLQGIPMGMPASWSILSVFHYLCLKAAGILNFAIRGDDAVFRTHEEKYQRYLSLVREVGFVMNLKKTFVSPSHATFCEEFYVLDGDFITKVPTVSLRVFNPEQISLSSIQESLSSDAYTPEKRHSIARLGAPYLFAFAKKYKVPAYLPTYYGGLGLPPKTARSSCNKRFEAKIRTIDTQGFNLPCIAAIRGPNSNRSSRGLAALRWSVSSDCRCTHYERLRSEMVMSSFLQDLKEGKAVRQPPSIPRQLRAQASAWSKVHPSYSDGMSGRPYLSLYGRQIYPVASDLESVFSHRSAVCKRHQLREKVVPTLSWAPTFFPI